MAPNFPCPKIPAPWFARQPRDPQDSSAQQGTGLLLGVIDLDLKHRISRFQLSTRCFRSIDRVEFRLEMPVDDDRKPFGRRPVGSCYFFWVRLLEWGEGVFY